MADTSTCSLLSCGETVEGTVDKCPKCGTKMSTSRSLRRLGWVILAAGLLITGVMGKIAWFYWPLLRHPGETIGGSSFSGSKDDAVLIQQVFSFVAGFGVVAIINGARQIVTGRRNRFFVILTVALFAMIFIAAIAIRQQIPG